MKITDGFSSPWVSGGFDPGNSAPKLDCLCFSCPRCRASADWRRLPANRASHRRIRCCGRTSLAVILACSWRSLSPRPCHQSRLQSLSCLSRSVHATFVVVEPTHCRSLRSLRCHPWRLPTPSHSRLIL